MASKFALCSLLLLLLSSTLLTVQAAQTYDETNKPRINVGLISSTLSDKGYNAMALTLETILKAITHNTTTLTLFCPQDHAFFSPKFPQPPLTLLKYHAVPFKLDRNTFEASFSHGSKVDTLLPGHPLVVTGHDSLNQVKVNDWDLYNNGRVIIHGVKDFFDPAFQTLRYPQYDAVVSVNEDSINKENKKELVGGFSWVKELTGNWFLLLALAAASICLLILFFIFCYKPGNGDSIEYSPLQNY